MAEHLHITLRPDILKSAKTSKPENYNNSEWFELLIEKGLKEINNAVCGVLTRHFQI